MYDTIWDYGDLPFKGTFANPIQIDTWVQVQSVNESEYILTVASFFNLEIAKQFFRSESFSQAHLVI